MQYSKTQKKNTSTQKHKFTSTQLDKYTRRQIQKRNFRVSLPENGLPTFEPQAAQIYSRKIALGQFLCFVRRMHTTPCFTSFFKLKLNSKQDQPQPSPGPKYFAWLVFIEYQQRHISPFDIFQAHHISLKLKQK